MIQLTSSYLQRFNGIARLYGQSAFEQFSVSHVAVIGIGGVGSWAIEALARSGVGHLTLIDMDDICVTNTNRQIHALQSTIGHIKAEAMAERVKQINPECEVTVVDDFITTKNVAEYLLPSFNYVIDAIDTLDAKAAILAYCRRNKIRVITIGGAGGQCDPTQIKISDLAKTVHDPLLSKLRQKLKDIYRIEKNSKGKLAIEAVFSTEQLRYPQVDGTVCAQKHSAQGSKRMDCVSGFGAITTVTATFGFVAVAHVLKKIAAKAQ